MTTRGELDPTTIVALCPWQVAAGAGGVQAATPPEASTAATAAAPKNLNTLSPRKQKKRHSHYLPEYKIKIGELSY
jgi:hypothetical protein